MKKLATYLFALTLLLLVGCQDSITGFEAGPVYSESEVSTPSDSPEDSEEPIIHNNGTEVGEVSISNIGYDLTIDVDLLEEGDHFYNRSVHVGPELDAIPRNPSGNPIPGQFANKLEFEDPYPNSITVEIELEKGDVGEDEHGEFVYIAFHADASIDGEEEGLWIGDAVNRINESDSGNWATYHKYYLSSESTCTEEEYWEFVDGTEAMRTGGSHDNPTGHFYIEGTPDGDFYNFDGTYDFGSFGTVEINGSTMTVSANAGLWLHNVRHQNTSDSEVNNFGGYEMEGPFGSAQPVEVDITDISHDAPYLYIQAQFKQEVCE